MNKEDWSMVKYCVFSRLEDLQERVEYEESNFPKQELIREVQRLDNLYKKIGGMLNEMS